MEAHNALSARIAEEAGFGGIWASGLSIAAALGVRDANEASWTQVLDVVEFMADAADSPILMDGDTGYGNFNNVRRLIAKLEPRGIAGVCLEDKLFPKTNSFHHGDTQPLAAVDEFCGRIRAAKDTQRDPDFVVVARTEAFIAGHGLTEALVRASDASGHGTPDRAGSLIRTYQISPDFNPGWYRDIEVNAGGRKTRNRFRGFSR